MPTSFRRIQAHRLGDPLETSNLFRVAETRAHEAKTANQLAPHALMLRAGLAVAQLAMAVAPHAKTIWIACGPGNNGGDGFEAARHLMQWGKEVLITELPASHGLPDDSKASRQAAIHAGATWVVAAPAHYDLCIDALFGIGPVRPWDALCQDLVQRINGHSAPVLAVDIPSGIHADTGNGNGTYVRADFTLCLLTLKIGLFTADGRDAAGEVWFHSLDTEEPSSPYASLNTPTSPTPRPHNTHKGSYGDVGIMGGDTGMKGAAVLAARAALHGGAGRVYLGLLDSAPMPVDILQPELMFRQLADMDFAAMTLVAGCGGGKAIEGVLPSALESARQLVLDADALNCIALSRALQQTLQQRPPGSTVLTPHPLEAARLMGISTAEVQANRITAAQTIADRFGCVVVLKGAGSIIAAPSGLPCVNITGNARLATAGTGDVLAGLIGAYFATSGYALDAACRAVFRHGEVADSWPEASALTADKLATRI